MDSRRLLCYLVLLYAHVLAALAGLERTCTLSDFYENRRVRLHATVSCSRRLPEMIKRLCRGAINIPGGSSIPGRRTRDTAAVESPSLEAGGSIFLDRISASKYLSKRDANGGSGTQGIVCECCVHPCRRSELMQYCAPRTRRSVDGFVALVKDRYDEAQVRKFYDEMDIAAQIESTQHQQPPPEASVRGDSGASSSAPATTVSGVPGAAARHHGNGLAAEEPRSGARWLFPSN